MFSYFFGKSTEQAQESQESQESDILGVPLCANFVIDGDSITYDVDSETYTCSTPTLNRHNIWEKCQINDEGLVTFLFKFRYVDGEEDSPRIYLLTMFPEYMENMFAQIFDEDWYEWEIMTIEDVKNKEVYVYDQNEFMNELLLTYFGFQFIRNHPENMIDRLKI